MIVTELLAKFGLSVDKASFAKADQGLRGILGTAQKIAGGIASAFLVREIGQFVNGLVTVGSELNDTSIKLGIATGALQEYRFAAQQAGVDQASLETGFRFLARSAFEAANGGKEASEVYRRLGVNVKDANGNVMGAEDLFADVAGALAGLDNETEKTALAMKVFGRGGQALLPLLAGGAEGIEKLRQEARELGGGFDPEFIKNADELGDNMDKFRFSALTVKNAIGNLLLPVLNRGVQTLIDWSKSINRILSGSRFLHSALLVIAAATTAWGVASLIAGRAAVLAWLQAAAPFLLAAAGIAAVALALDDVHALLTGGKSLLGQYIDEWLGIGTVDKFVQGWSLGVEILTNNLKELVEIGKLAASVIGSFFSGDFSGAVSKATELGDRIAARIKGEANSLIEGVQSFGFLFDTPAVATAGRTVDAVEASDLSIPRTAGRGIHAPLAPGSPGFGQARASSVSPFLAPGEVSAAGSSPGVTVQNTANVNVHARTGADPNEIAQVAGRVVSEKLRDQNRNARSALVNRAK